MCTHTLYIKNVFSVLARRVKKEKKPHQPTQDIQYTHAQEQNTRCPALRTVYLHMNNPSRDAEKGKATTTTQQKGKATPRKLRAVCLLYIYMYVYIKKYTNHMDWTVLAELERSRWEMKSRTSVHSGSNPEELYICKSFIWSLHLIYMYVYMCIGTWPTYHIGYSERNWSFTSTMHTTKYKTLLQE